MTNQTYSIKYTNLSKPLFNISLPENIIATANENQVINLDVINYETNDLKNFKYKWTVNPEVKEGEVSFNERQYIITSGGLLQNTEYDVTVEM